MNRQLRKRLAALAVAVVTAALLPALTTPSVAAEPGEELFTHLPDFAVGQGARSRVVPRRSAAYRVDLTGVGARLASAPGRAALVTGARPLRFTLPDPAGRMTDFAVHESPVMAPRLAARHPDIHTYAGVGLTDPTTTIRLDVTGMGFHASVRGPGGARSWYVDPAYNRSGTTTHLSYYGASVPEPERPFVEPDLAAAARALPDAPRVAPGDEVRLRTYRLAFANDPTYAAHFGTTNVAAEKATLVNRVNQIYSDDLAIRLVLVDGNDRLNLDTAAKATGANGPCGANACFTPAQLAGCSSSTISRNIFVVGQVVGADAYDIGHLGLGVDGGGIAGLGVVGGDRKAAGCTGLKTPEGDFYAIDYVAHEMGHQFAGNHTFNGTTGNCATSNRNAATSVEPGSGSSVMAYAGICGRDNLQPHSDPYFSQRSIDEITAHVTRPPATSPGEQQVVNLRGLDPGDSFRLTYPGAGSVTLTDGVDYNAAGIAVAVKQLTGFTPRVSGYDGAASPSAAGFTLDFDVEGSTVDLATLGVEGASGGVTGFVGTVYNGGPETNQGTASATGNHAPQVSAPADRTIPLRTPFTLTATGSDPDGDALTYLWEQNDAGRQLGTALLDNTKTNGPLFRVFGTAAPVTPSGTLLSPSPGLNLADGNRSRTFPDLTQVLAGQTNAETGQCPAPPSTGPVPAAVVDCFSEFLPTTDYATPLAGRLTFRVTARDGAAEGGGTAYDDVVLTLDGASGPFLVTSRRTAGAAADGGTPETVTWDVNGTAAPTLAPQVRILLSTDGGRTYPRVLAETTANDGSESVTLPQVTTTRARVRVEAVGNYFFDVSDADFTINATGPETSITAGPRQGSFVLRTAVTMGYDATGVTPMTFECTLDGADAGCADATSVRLSGLSTGPHVFTVAARDADGVLDATPARRAFVSPYDDRQLDRRGDWQARRARSAYRGTFLRASSKGERLSMRADDVTRIALVVGTAPGYGRVAVHFRGELLRTVSLASSRTRGRVLRTVARFDQPRSGVVSIRTLSGRTVRIEGLGIS